MTVSARRLAILSDGDRDQLLVEERAAVAELAQRAIDNHHENDPLPESLVVRLELNDPSLPAATRKQLTRVAWDAFKFGVETGRDIERMVCGDQHPGYWQAEPGKAVAQ